MELLATDHDADTSSEERVDVSVEEEIPDLVQVLLYNRTLLKMHEVRIFNTPDVIPLMVIGGWYAILSPDDETKQLFVWFNDAGSYDEVMLHSALLAQELHIPGTIRVRPLLVTGKYENIIFVTELDEKDKEDNSVIELTDGVFAFSYIH